MPKYARSSSHVSSFQFLRPFCFGKRFVCHRCLHGTFVKIKSESFTWRRRGSDVVQYCGPQIFGSRTTCSGSVLLHTPTSSSSISASSLITATFICFLVFLVYVALHVFCLLLDGQHKSREVQEQNSHLQWQLPSATSFRASHSGGS